MRELTQKLTFQYFNREELKNLSIYIYIYQIICCILLMLVGGRIRLGFDFTLQSTNEEVHSEQNATIQSLEEVPNGDKSASSPLFQHAVEFYNVDPRMLSLVYELHQEIR